MSKFKWAVKSEVKNSILKDSVWDLDVSLCNKADIEFIKNDCWEAGIGAVCFQAEEMKTLHGHKVIKLTGCLI